MEKKLEKQQLSWRLKSSQVSKINQELEQNNGKTKVTGNLKTGYNKRSRSARTPIQTEETR